jgi:HAD superfamily hydrolase (TIGR01484 family)
MEVDLKMIAVDLDGTLLGGTTERYGCLPEGLEALRQATRYNRHVAIVTGRDIDFIRRLLSEEGIDPVREGWPHVIIAEERYIYYWNNDNYVSDEVWNRSVFEAEYAHFAAIRQGVNELIAGEMARIDASCFRVEGDIEERRGFVEVRFIDAFASREGEKLLAEWLLRRGLSFITVRNVAGVAIRHSSVGKGPTLAQVCRDLNVPFSAVLAIGDSSNDLSMLDGTLGFLSAAPGNAEKEVKDKIREGSGYVAEGCYGCGVAEAVAHYEQKV